MDCFIKITPQKNQENKTTIHKKEFKIFQEHLKSNTNVIICGNVGSGKTHFLNCILDEQNSIEITHENISNKSTFLDCVRGSSKHLFIDDYDPTYYPYKNIFQSICDGERYTNGSHIISTNQFYLGVPNFEVIYLPVPTINKLLSIKSGPGGKKAAEKSKGNIRNFLSYINEESDEKDEFKTPKEYIHDILCEKTHETILDSKLTEHGHVADIFQENYIDSKNVNYSRASMSFSDADIYDASIYEGKWELMPYYALSSVSIPKSCMTKPLKRENIRPGSSWTKFGNMKMRYQKVKAINFRTKSIGSSVGVEELCLLKKHAEQGNIDILMKYNLLPADFDVMNHLAISSKLKQKQVTHIKKSMKNAIQGQ